MQHENRMPRLLLLASTLAFAAGCSIVNDADDFVIDEGCNLDLTIERFIPHVRQRVEYRVVHEDGDGIVLDDGRVTPRLDALAVFEPLGFENGRLIMPGSVFPQTSTGLRAGGVDFWADVNRTMGFQFDPSSADHGWSLSDICRDLPRATANVPVSPFFADADEGSVFVHNVDFDDLIDPDGLPLGVEVEFEGLAGGLPDGVNVDDVRVEVHVEGVELPARSGTLGEREDRAVGFWRTNSIRALLDRDLILTGSAQLPSILIDGENYRVRVLLDVDGDDFFAAGGTDRAFEFEFPATEAGLPLCALRRDENGLCERTGRKFNSAGEGEDVTLISVLVNPRDEPSAVDEAADNWLQIIP